MISISTILDPDSAVSLLEWGCIETLCLAGRICALTDDTIVELRRQENTTLIKRLQHSLEAQHLHEISLTHFAELQAFAQLCRCRRLTRAEASSIAAASVSNCELVALEPEPILRAIDDACFTHKVRVIGVLSTVTALAASQDGRIATPAERMSRALTRR